MATFRTVALVLALTALSLAHPLPRNRVIPPSPVPACTFTAGAATALFRGITTETARITCPAPVHTAAPLHSTAEVVRVDLTAPGLSFESSRGTSFNHFNLQLPTAFLQKTHSQVAVNANLFTRCCTYTPPANPETQLLGLEISHGRVYSPYHNRPQKLPATFPFSASLEVIGRRLEITTQTPGPGVSTSVTGSHLLVWQGRNVAPRTQLPHEFFGPNARTLAGLSAGNTVLWLAAVDHNPTSAGITLPQAAQLMLHLGAASALNLDGGGSTSLAVEGSHGQPQLLNDPGDGVPNCTFPRGSGCERYVGATFAIHAQPLPRK